jgi:L-alanine-DL-glutamate epimerase-like enolase superfamily enzyme
MLTWSIKELKLVLKYSWKISRNESSYKRNFIITVTDNKITASGEVAPNIRYGETPELILEHFSFLPSLLESVTTLKELTEVIDRKQLPSSLRFGIESAFVHYLSKKNTIPVYTQLGLKSPVEVYTSYTLPIMHQGEVKDFIDRHNLLRFKYLKIKINQETGPDLIEEVAKASALPLRIDANEAWQDVDNLLVLMEKTKKYNIDFFEQPLPSAMVEEYKYLKKHSPYELIADESVTNHFDVEEIAAQFHGVNMKLMKAGGYVNGIDILQKSRDKGLKTMIGCMVETSLGIFSAINLCNGINYIDLDGYFLIENEPFKMVSEREGGLLNVT